MQYPELRYVPESDDPSVDLQTDRLRLKIIDNTGLLAPPVESHSYFNSTLRFTPFTHHLGYHGIRTFYDKAERRNLVVPFASWFNLQSASLAGIEPDPVDDRAWAGQGRGWPIRLEQAGEGVVLRLDPLPSTAIQYSLELWPAEADAVDFSIRFVFGRRPDSGPVRFRASWPCYVNAYDDVRLFYPKGPSADEWQWASLGERPDFVLGETVHYQHSQQTFRAVQQALPLGFGRIGKRALILMFSDPSVRLYVVNGGGHLFCSSVQGPAWDFEWIVDDYPLHTALGFNGRLIYTRFEGAAAVLQRYHAWRRQREG